MKEKYFRFFDIACLLSLCSIAFFIPISTALIEIFACLAIITYAVKKIIKPEFKFLINPTHLFLSLFFIFMAISFLNSGPFIIKSLKALILKWLEYILIFIIAEDTLSTPKRIKSVLTVLIFGAVLMGIDALSQSMFSFEFIRNRGLTEFNKNTLGVSASFKHANDFGTYLNIILSFLISCLFIKRERKITHIGLWSLIILLEICLLLTFSRAGIITFAIILIYLITLSKKFKYPAIIFLLVILLITFLQGYKFKNMNLISLLSGDNFGRLHIWKVALRMISENPFLGKGLGTFMDYFSKYAPNLYAQYAHNCYLQIWAESGFFSLLSFLMFVAAIFYSSIKNYFLNKDYILLGLLGGILGFLVHSAFDTDFYSLQLAVLFWFMLGLSRAKLISNQKYPSK